MAKRLPIRINPCPIIDAVVELRFVTDIHPSAIFGIIYNSIKEKYGIPEGLPILQLPEAVRISDPNLKYKPHYKLSNERFVLQIGPNVISISSFPNYVGWRMFYEGIEQLIVDLKTIKIITSVERIGLRYLDFFEGNVLDNLEINMRLNELSITNQTTFLRTEIANDPYKSLMQISNNIQHNGKIGTMIDIDTFVVEKGIAFEESMKIIDEGHSIHKSLFFNLLKDEFIESLDPIYEESNGK